MAVAYDRRLARGLVLDELFDLSLYQALHARATGELRRTLGELIAVETKHCAFWQDLIVAAAVAVTYLIGLGVRALWGIEVG